MTSYQGRYAELYDVIYDSKPYAEEAAFIHRCLQSYAGREVHRILEIACGTGSHAMALLNYGYEIVAIDHSPDMLARAIEKTKLGHAAIDFRLQDMRALELPGEEFDAAISLFDSVGYAGDDDSILEVFRNIHRQLRPLGLFVFEFWHAPAMLGHYSPVRVGRWPLRDGELLRLSETSLQLEERTATVHYTLLELFKDGHFHELRETQRNRFFDIPEMNGLLLSSGFEAVRWFAGFSENEPISDQTWHIVCAARRRPSA